VRKIDLRGVRITANDDIHVKSTLLYVERSGIEKCFIFEILYLKKCSKMTNNEEQL